MKNLLLQVDARGDLPKVVQGVAGLVGLGLAFGCCLLVRDALPASAGLAQGALAVLFVGAAPGFVTLLGVVAKVWQGARVRVPGAGRVN